MDPRSHSTLPRAALAVLVLLLVAVTGTVLAQEESASRGNVVLVHGAWADGSTWAEVVDLLTEEGFDVTAPQFPLLASLEENLALLREVLDVQEGPTLLVGHSHGGILVSMVDPDAYDLAGLAFIAGVTLEEGESLGRLLADDPPVPVDVITGEEGFAWLPREDFSPDPESDVDPADAYLLHVARQPLFGGAPDTTMPRPAWRSLPTWYLITTEDDVIGPGTQRDFADRMEATVLEVEAGHLAMASHPDEVARFLAQAAEEAFAAD